MDHRVHNLKVQSVPLSIERFSLGCGSAMKLAQPIELISSGLAGTVATRLIDRLTEPLSRSMKAHGFPSCTDKASSVVPMRRPAPAKTWRST